MQRIIYLSIILLSLLSAPAYADFRDGLEAYRDGDYKVAFEAWLPLAKSGDAKSQNNLGILYRKGRGVSKNAEKAFEWYERAAKQGFAKAQYNLALLYKSGQGVTRDLAKSVRWIELSARNGYARAQYELGIRYEKGVGVQRDPVKALVWLSLSVESAKGDTMKRAAKARGRLIGALSQQEISEARRLADEIRIES